MAAKSKKEQNVSLDQFALGKVLRVARDNLRFSYRELATKCDVSATQLLRIESGEFEYSAAKLFRICSSLSVPLADLLEFATVRHFVFPASELWDHREVIDALDFALDNQLDSTVSKERLKLFIENQFQWAAYALTASNEDYAGLSDPAIAEMNHSAFSEIFRYSNVERRAGLSALLENPCEKLSGLGLIHFEKLTQALYDETLAPWRPPVPSSIRTILNFSHQPEVTHTGASEGQSKSALDKLAGKEENRAVIKASSSVGALILRAAKFTARRGMQTELARVLGVTRQAISIYFSGKAMPDAEKTLKLLKWVEEAEAKQKQSGISTAMPIPPKTPKGHDNDKAPQSGRARRSPKPRKKTRS